ncbi:helix-turn-helix transcriptional regulator [Pseudoalteromonas sp. SCSIO 43201]|uniref:helix-turn-helix domain-containing protein n=1 Tax=Pseudoalteromonas sp. SCSIO 43201 TaxID=2822842 RepID=UPI0020766515|nr:helix-turn-helix transcriptional regulator [Pseudoalteromonas sp. SCSIO 43201]USD30286.1 helix-turn-helix transcriptional regulator [Pseudoalteromonas sp. SCSIO 43201]
MQTPEEYEVSQRVGQLIQGLKHRRGMSKETICRHLDISTRTLDNYLSGASSFKLGTLLKFADLCRVRLADILDDTETLSRLYPNNLKDKSTLVTLIMTTALSSLVFEPIICSLICILLILFRSDRSCASLALIFAAIFSLDVFMIAIIKYLIFPNVESNFIQNTSAFGIQLCINIVLLSLLKNRQVLLVLVSRGSSCTAFEKNYAEGPLYFLVMFMTTVDLLALVENFIRNLEKVGVNEEFAKIFWEVTFFYDYFEYLKALPMLLCVAVLYIGFIVRQQPLQNPQHLI